MVFSRPRVLGPRAVGLVLVPALLVGVAAAAAAQHSARADWTATGSVDLALLAGARPAYELAPFAGDLDHELRSARSQRAIDTELKGAAHGSLTASRVEDENLVTVTLGAASESAATAGLRAGTGAAFEQLVLTRQREHAYRTESAQGVLDLANAALVQASSTTGTPGQVDAARQFVTQAVQELAAARTDLQLTRRLQLVDPLSVVTVDDVVEGSVLPQVVRAGAAGTVGGGVVGLLVMLLLLPGRRETGTAGSPQQDAPGTAPDLPGADRPGRRQVVTSSAGREVAP